VERNLKRELFVSTVEHLVMVEDSVFLVDLIGVKL
jgi:hypothetical protein